MVVKGMGELDKGRRRGLETRGERGKGSGGCGEGKRKEENIASHGGEGYRRTE